AGDVADVSVLDPADPCQGGRTRFGLEYYADTAYTTFKLRSRWQIDAWAKTYKAARDLGDAIRGDGAASALSRWSGTLDSTAVQDIFLENELPLSEPGVGEEDMLYRNTQDYMVHYKE
ncbi:hypothetical protein LCGC14_2293960, partial [marine sediment metagenome]